MYCVMNVKCVYKHAHMYVQYVYINTCFYMYCTCTLQAYMYFKWCVSITLMLPVL